MPALPTIGVDLRALVPEATGIGVYTRSLLLALAARQGGRYVGLSHRPARGPGELAAAGVELEAQAAPLGVLWQQLRLPRRLARGDLDLFFSPLGILPLSCPVPSVITVHDLTVLLLPETHRLKVRLSQLPFLRHSLEQATRIAAVSQATADDLAFHFPQCAERVRVVHNGVDPDFSPGHPEEIAATRRRLGCPGGYLLYAGTLEPRKNLGALLDAWEALRRDHPETTPPLVLAGGYGWRSGDLLRRLERMGARMPKAEGDGRGATDTGTAGIGAGSVERGAESGGGGLPPSSGDSLSDLGSSTPASTSEPPPPRLLGRLERPHLVRVIQAARLFVYPSLYEGFGLPPAEAMACGVPVVTSDSSSLPEVVGDAGLTVPSRDPGALAEAIHRLLTDTPLAAELAERGRRRVQRFTWQAAAAAMEELFQEALAHPDR